MSAVSGSMLPEVSPGRKRKDAIMRGLLMGGTGLALVPLILIIYYLIYKGVGSWSGSFFTTDPSGNFFGWRSWRSPR
jgi:phosphate transport system permease protein